MTLARSSIAIDRAKVKAIEHKSISNPLFPTPILRNYQDLQMLKLTSLALGLLTAISIVPAAQALPFSDRNPVIVGQTVRDNRTPVVMNVTASTYRGSEDRRGGEVDRRRQSELVREREAQARWDAAHPRHQYTKYHHFYHDRHRYNEYRRDRY
jgi:hypothetical protein